MTNTEDTRWTIPNANVRIGTTIKVRLSDAPDFTGVVMKIQEDDVFGASFEVCTTRGLLWIGEARIIAVAA